ncbi:MAG: hypothetical protein ACRD0U_13110 [Acidimicrobiales bacterium]
MAAIVGLPGQARPSAIAVDEDVDLFYVGYGALNSVARFNGVDLSAQQTFPDVGSGLRHVAVDPSTGVADVTEEGSTTLVVIEGDQVGLVEIGNGAQGVGIDPVNSTVYVANPGVSGLTVLGSTGSAVTLSSFLNPAVTGEPLTFTATVVPGGGGTVTFTADGTPISGCEAVPVVEVEGRDQASCTTASLGERPRGHRHLQRDCRRPPECRVGYAAGHRRRPPGRVDDHRYHLYHPHHIP